MRALSKQKNYNIDFLLSINNGTKSTRYVKIGPGRGLKVEDSQGNVMHDVPDNSLQGGWYMGHLVFPPQQTYSSTRIYHEVGQNVPVNATKNTILDTLSFGYDNIQGIRLYVEFLFYYNLAKYPPVPYEPKNVHGSISFKPYNVTWWTEEQQQRINPNITKIDFINPFLSMQVASYYLTKYGYVDVPVGENNKIEMKIYSHPYISNSENLSVSTYVKVYQSAIFI